MRSLLLQQPEASFALGTMGCKSGAMLEGGAQVVFYTSSSILLSLNSSRNILQLSDAEGSILLPISCCREIEVMLLSSSLLLCALCGSRLIPSLSIVSLAV